MWLIESPGRSLLFSDLTDAIRYIQDDRTSIWSIRYIQIYVSPEKKKKSLENMIGEPLSRSKDS